MSDGYIRPRNYIHSPLRIPQHLGQLHKEMANSNGGTVQGNTLYRIMEMDKKDNIKISPSIPFNTTPDMIKYFYLKIMGNRVKRFQRVQVLDEDLKVLETIYPEK